MNPDMEFYIHSNFILLDEYRKSELYALNNVKFIADFNKIKHKLNLFGAVLSTDMQATPPHQYSLQIANIFQKLGVPVIEIQHGLFQLGLHYNDVPQHENFYDDSLPGKPIADYIFTYYPLPAIGNTVSIGYPPYIVPLKASYTGEYGLILSNMHWTAYSQKEKYLFYASIMEFIEKHPKITFIWKMHHGEIAAPQTAKMLDSLSKLFTPQKNMVFSHQTPILKKIDTDELIAKSKFVLSSVSTTLLDCEKYEKFTCIYATKSVECLLSKIAEKSTFRNYTDLVKLFKSSPPPLLRSSLLYPYDNEAFRKIIGKIYRLSERKFDISLLSEPMPT